VERHGLVIGGSIAGLLAARALAGHLPRVTLVERDEYPADPVPRRGVPQGSHIHVLWAGGREAIDRLLPGLFDELAAEGAVAFDNSADMRWFQHGVWKLRIDSGFRMVSQTRPLLEQAIRRRVLTNDRITLRAGAVTGVLADAGRVGGVRTDAGPLAADLVVDASGRGSRLPAWLAEHGWASPRTAEVAIDLGYASRLYRIPSAPRRDWSVMAVYPEPPRSTKAAVIFPVEGDRWIVTLGGSVGDHPGGDETGFQAFLDALDRPDLAAALRDAEPLGPISTMRFPRERRRFYERMRRRPGGLVVVGDALCSFNPLFGQGVSVAALEAVALDGALGRAGVEGAPDAYFRAARAVVDDPWRLATLTDLIYPRAVGHRPPGARWLQWYLGQVLRLTGSDEGVYRRFLAVVHLTTGLRTLFHPRVLAAVLVRAAGSRR
jgi:2-polyprenyl-6-methoxyphenol hydroxylase-like FAD-dependent oxidoreductase